jgi:hypothetical protein
MTYIFVVGLVVGIQGEYGLGQTGKVTIGVDMRQWANMLQYIRSSNRSSRMDYMRFGSLDVWPRHDERTNSYDIVPHEGVTSNSCIPASRAASTMNTECRCRPVSPVCTLHISQ